MTWTENIPSCRFSFLWFPSLTYNTEGSKSRANNVLITPWGKWRKLHQSLRHPQTVELCWTEMNTFLNLMVLQYLLLVLLQLLFVTKHSVAVNWISRWKVLPILRKDFLLLTRSSEQLHFLYGLFVRLSIFFTTTVVGTHAFLLRAPSAIPAVLHMCLSFLQYITDFTFMGISPEICSIATLLDGSLTLSV